MSQNILATIRLKSPDQAERIISVREGENVRIGRDDNNDIVISDPAISRVHATISASTSGVLVADNRSTNGTFVNGKRITMRDLQSGDVIDLGSSKLLVEVQATKAVEQLSAMSGARAMTAQLKPVAVTVLVGTLLVTGERREGAIPADEICQLWMEHAVDIIKEFSGTVDKEVGNHLVALWMGSDSKQQALAAVKAAQKMSYLTNVLSQQISAAALDAKLILSSGHGLKGMVGAMRKDASNSFTLLGDPVNTAFVIEEGVVDLNEQIIICPSTAELIQSDFDVESTGTVSDGEDGVLQAFKLTTHS